MKVGLTGNMYSGLNDVADMFISKNIPVFDADVILRFLINYRYDLVDDIKLKLGNVYKNGFLDPSKFLNTDKFDKLVDFYELEILKAYEVWRMKQNGFPYTIFKSSILFERNWDKSMNYVMSVYKPKDSRQFEMKMDTNKSMIEVNTIISNEMDELMKNQRSTYIIHNYENSDSPIKQVNQYHRSLLQKAEKYVNTSL